MIAFQKIFQMVTSIIGAASCWWMGITLFRVLQNPMSIEDGRWVKLGVGIMIFEFFAVHSGAMFLSVSAGSGKEKMKRSLLAVGLYGLFGVIISLVFKSWMLFGLFSGMIISRWLGALDRNELFDRQQLWRTQISIILYLMIILLTAFIPLPQGGITSSVLQRAWPDRYANGGGGAWLDNPQNAIWAGIVYFSLMGITELFLPTLAKKFRPQIKVVQK